MALPVERLEPKLPLHGSLVRSRAGCGEGIAGEIATFPEPRLLRPAGDQILPLVCFAILSLFCKVQQLCESVPPVCVCVGGGWGGRWRGWG